MLASVDLGKAVRWGKPRQFAALASLFTPAWAIEEKFDGWRVWIVIDKAGTRLLTATADLTHTAAALAAVRGSRAGLTGTTVLDAEVMAPPLPGETYAPLGRTQSWMRAKPADARMLAAYFKRGPVLKVFDVLTLAGTDVTGNSYDERRGALEALLPMLTAAYPDAGLELVERYPATAATVEMLLDRGAEGVMFKYTAGRQQPGKRSDAWRKLKAAGTVDVELTGNWKAGSRPGEIGSVEAAVTRPDGSPLVVASVAVKPQLVAEYTRRAAGGTLAGIVWELEANGWTGEALRHPRMKRERPDKPRGQCPASQLAALPAVALAAAPTREAIAA